RCALSGAEPATDHQGGRRSDPPALLVGARLVCHLSKPVGLSPRQILASSRGSSAGKPPAANPPACIRSHVKGFLMKRTLALVALAAGFAATPALAQSSAPGGLYLGALGGYEGIDLDAADGSASASADSAVFGVTAGYDISLGSAFVGV